ncbi:helix-turn-helix transcriptional regulator [Pseudomonas sp. v388]|uniref:helix-turn-helix domain-containing protein n=1 Tax=Pseudomonas sp. v388 TaxID=2479849 RepID=UPI000F78365D|nr:helix-turn-helix domain-containing protein [Pseudomonas sp. v388]RRV05153.1 helix-turn-helix transcriptional regulator [Pseudomonas sp. v388]
MKHANPRTGDASLPLYCAPDPSRVRLTAKEHEVLEWAAKGKSAWEIARILGRSEAAINFHMCNIRRKFGVSSLRAALVMAIVQGIILL